MGLGEGKSMETDRPEELPADNIFKSYTEKPVEIAETATGTLSTKTATDFASDRLRQLSDSGAVYLEPQFKTTRTKLPAGVAAALDIKRNFRFPSDDSSQAD